MIQDAALLTVSAVLAVQMGLTEAIQTKLSFKSQILSCPRCLTFWLVLAWLLVHDAPLILSIAASFICSYCALWLCLLYDAIATIYNKAYGKIYPETDTEEAETDADEVP